jgi:hypothetical protein
MDEYCIRLGCFSKPYKNLTVPNLALPDLGPIPLAEATAVLQLDVPAVPTANDFTHLHDAFTQGKTQVRAQVFERVNLTVPSE